MSQGTDNSTSKYWKDMYIPKGDEPEGIISKLPPVNYESNKKISLHRSLKPEEYDEFCDFIKKQNKMSSGNYTLLPKGELLRILKFNPKVITMRGGNKNSLLGTLISVPFPIKSNHKVITHGCTSYLNVHNILRNNGLAMALIRELIQWGFEDNIYCDYHLTDHKIGENAIQISSWYRPINLPKSIGLGFTIPDFNVPHLFAKNRLKYNTKAMSGFKTVRVLQKNQDKALDFYKKICKQKLALWPDLELFSKWIQQFPTFMVRTKENKKIVGIFSINNLFCRMGEEVEGKLCIPILFNCRETFNQATLRALINTAHEREFDVLYLYQTGDLNRECLESVNAIETNKKSWFSLYNNVMNLQPEDISVPLL